MLVFVPGVGLKGVEQVVVIRVKLSMVVELVLSWLSCVGTFELIIALENSIRGREDDCE